MKLVYKIAMIGTVLASGIVTASAQTTRRSYDQPDRYWNQNNGSFYNGRMMGGYYNNDPIGYRSGNTDTNPLATPGTQEDRDIISGG